MKAFTFDTLPGVPYVDICVKSLKMDEVLTPKIRDLFLGTVGRGYLFVFEEERNSDGDSNNDTMEEWTHVTPLSSFLTNLGDKLAVHEEEIGIEKILNDFLSAMETTISQGKYDTRTRVVS